MRLVYTIIHVMLALKITCRHCIFMDSRGAVNHVSLCLQSGAPRQITDCLQRVLAVPPVTFKRHRQKSLARFWMFIIPLRDFESLLFMCCLCVYSCMSSPWSSELLPPPVCAAGTSRWYFTYILPACVTSLVGAEVGVVLTPQAVACTHVYTHNQERERKIKGETC